MNSPVQPHAVGRLLTLGALLLAVLTLGACGGDGVIRKVGDLPAPPPGAGFVEVDCDPPTAELYVDGVYRGRLDGYRNGVIRMPEGVRRVALRQNGYYPWYGTAEVGQATVVIKTRLVPEVP